MLLNFRNLIIVWISLVAAGYFGISSLIVGGVAEASDIYLRPPIGVVASVVLAVVAAGMVYKIAGLVAVFIVPFLMVLVVLAGQVGFLPGPIDNFMNDATLRVMPKEKTVEAHMSQEERYCKQDRYCMFAPINDESLAVFRNDAIVKGHCNRAYDCRLEINRATVTGGLISLNLRKEFPEIRSAYFHAIEIDRQSLSVDVGGPMGDAAAKLLVKNICSSVKEKKFPGVEIKKVEVMYLIIENGLRERETIIDRRC